MISGQHAGVAQLIVNISYESSPQHGHELHIFHLMQQWQSIQMQDVPSSESKTTGTSKSSSTRGNKKKSGMTHHTWKEKGSNLPMCDKVKIIDWEGYWKRKRLK